MFTSQLNKVIIILMLTAINTAFSQENTNSKFGKGLFNKVAIDSSWTMKMSLRTQFLTSSDWDIDSNDKFSKANTLFTIRRARLKFDGYAYSPKIKYKLELGLSNKDVSGATKYTSNSPRIILDAVVKWNFYNNFELWLGQTKLPGNRGRLISSGNLQFVDRSILNKEYNIDRDIGMQLHHYFILGKQFIVKEVLSVSQGEGRNITSENMGGLQFTSKLELLPFGEFKSKGNYSGGDLKREDKPKLALAISYDHNNNAVRTKSNSGDYMLIEDDLLFETSINTMFIDAILKYKSFSTMFEYANRKAENAIVRNIDGTTTGEKVNIGTALNLQMGYLFSNNWEVATRYTTINPDQIISSNNKEQYTLGFSKYVAGHKLKIQTDISYTQTKNKQDDLMFRMQVDIHF